MPTAHEDIKPDMHGGAVHIPRSRGAVSGVLLIVLGAWAAIIPFIGPLFSYAYTPNKAWAWTAARGWLEVLPGAVALLAGVMLVVSANRITASAAAWLGAASGIWLVIGRDVAAWLHIGSPGKPASSSPFLAALESLGLFSGIGAAIVLTSAFVLGRLTIRSVRDVKVAQKRERKTEKQRREISDSAYAAGRRDEAEYETGRRDEAAAHHYDGASPTTGSAQSRRGGLVGRLTHRGGSTRSEEGSGASAADEQPRR